MDTAAAGQARNDSRLAEFLNEAIYEKLVRRAAGILRGESYAYYFDARDLVHEAFLRISRSQIPVRFQSAAHVIALATIVMRRILVDHARASRSAGQSIHISLVAESDLSAELPREIQLLRDALSHLATSEARRFRIVEMKFFGGFRMQEMASELKISGRTVRREWTSAREWLYVTLS